MSPRSSPRGGAFKGLNKIGGVTKARPWPAVLSLEGTPDLCYHTGKARRTQLDEILVGNQTWCSAFQLPEAGGSRSPVDAIQPACGILSGQSKLNDVPETYLKMSRELHLKQTEVCCQALPAQFSHASYEKAQSIPLFYTCSCLNSFIYSLLPFIRPSGKEVTGTNCLMHSFNREVPSITQLSPESL